MIPLVLKPRLKGTKNRWTSGQKRRSKFIGDSIVICFGLLVLYAIYYGTWSALGKIAELSNYVYMPPSQPIAVILLFLFISLIVSSLATALASLFLSRDLELLLSSPISRAQFFWGKYTHVLLESSWMPVIFIFPFLIAFGEFYSAPLQYYLLAPIVLLPYFLLPAAAAMFFAPLFSMLVPAKRLRAFLAFLILLLVIAFAMMLDLLKGANAGMSSTAEIMRLLSILSLPGVNWLPSNWVASCLGQLLSGGNHGNFPELALLYSSALACASLAFIMLRLYYKRALASATNVGQHAKRRALLTSLLSQLCFFLSNRFKAFFGKEFKLVSRDMAQAMQILILLTISMVYLYNIRVFRSIDTLPEDLRNSWSAFLYIANFAMGSFVATAICTRFVFPSVSLEGRAYWIIQSAPLDIATYMRTKFWSWFVLIALISGSLFAAGAAVIGAGSYAIAISTLGACIVSYGIVGLAIGMGATFANFNWDHPSQLAASIGSLSYILVSVIVVALSLLPAGFVLFLKNVALSSGSLSYYEWIAGLTASVAFLVYLNYLVKREAFNLGERALKRHLVL
jgi:ABC-2 type transport system permease protein